MYEDSQVALEQYFKDNWTTTQVAWENESFANQIVDEYVRFSVLFTNSSLTALGDRCKRLRGLVTVQVFVRVGVGTARAIQLADLVVGLFSTKIISLHQFSVSEIIKLPGQEPNWYQVQVVTGFYIDKEGL